MIRADAADPGVHLVRVYIKAGFDLRVSLGDHLRLPGDAGSPLRVGFGTGRLTGVKVQRVHRVRLIDFVSNDQDSGMFDQDNRHVSRHLFGAIGPARGGGDAAIMRAMDAGAMNEHLKEINVRLARRGCISTAAAEAMGAGQAR